MFSHITIGTNDLARAMRFYDAVLNPLGLVQRQVIPDGAPDFACWIHPYHPRLRFYVVLPLDERPANPGNGTMVAFLAPDRETVDLAFKAGLAAGGQSAGDPGPRPHYSPVYYGAYLRDPDGNKIHFAHNPE